MKSRLLSTALLVAACLSAPCRAAPPMRPNGPPPDLMTVRIGPDGNLVSNRVNTVYQYETRARKVVVGGKEEVITETVAVPVAVTTAIRHAARDVKAFDLDGLPIDAGKLPKLLEKDTSVIVSPDGQPPDAFYRQFFKEGTLLLVLPARTGNTPITESFPPPRPRVMP